MAVVIKISDEADQRLDEVAPPYLKGEGRRARRMEWAIYEHADHVEQLLKLNDDNIVKEAASVAADDQAVRDA